MDQPLSAVVPPTKSPIAIRMKGISKAFGGVQALQNVDLEIHSGEIHALLGENGAGKSTLVKILCGIEAPDAGSIDIEDRQIKLRAGKARHQSAIATVFQEVCLVPTLSVAQNIFLGHEPYNHFGFINDRRAIREACSLFEVFGVKIDPTVPAGQLGPRDRQLTGIIKAVSQQARILVLDEPTSALSGTEVERLNTLLRSLKSEGVAIIYVSPRVEEIMRIADRASILCDGKRVVTAPISELTLEMIVEHTIGRHSPGFSKALRESEQRFRQLAENIQEVFWVVDPNSEQIIYVSPAFEQVWGRGPETLGDSVRGFLETVYEDDRPSIAMEYASRLGVPVSPELEYRIRRPDGSIRWIRDRAFPIQGENGQMHRLVRITEDITERKRVQEELQYSFAQLRALAARLESVREEERTRVAREIHDELGQALTAIKIDLSSWVQEIVPDRENPLQDAESILKLVDQTIQTVRRIATSLRPGILDDLGLVAAVEWAAEDFEARTGTKCLLDLPSEIVVDEERATAVFRIFQETLTNVARHANATQLQVRLAEVDGSLSLEVRDNGKGVNDEQLSAGGSLGILGMRERALLFGGEVRIYGIPGQGTTVFARIPQPATTGNEATK